MHWGLWILVGIVAVVLLVYLGFFTYFRLFSKKVTKASNRILKILDEDGLLENFRQNKPYDEIKETYCEFIDMIAIFSQYMHFLTLKAEKKQKRINDCIILQYVEVDGKKVARFHFRAFPIRTLLEKLKPKEMMIDAFNLVEDLLYKDKEIAYMEFITHNKLFNESIVKKMIARGNLRLEYTYTDQFENGYLPWIYSEWLMIHGKDNSKSPEVYEELRKLNRSLNIKLYRRGELPDNIEVK